MRIVMIGPFGMGPRMTMRVRAWPMAKALVARGHRVTLVLPPWQNQEDAGRHHEEDGVAVENVRLPPHIPVLFHLLVTLRLASATLALRPDVVHLFKPKAYSGLTHWLLARIPRARRPRLVVDADDWEGSGGWNEIGGYTWAQRRLFAWQERWGLTHADYVTVASRALESLVWALGVAPQRVFYVPNGVKDIPGVRAQVSDNEHPVILLYTRFFEFPVSRVISVLQYVRKTVTRARLLVVGEGLFGEERQLLDMSRQVGLADAIDYTGWVDAAALPEFFDRADVAIYPFDDTLINRTKCAVKLLELLAAGVPVVAEAVGQNREMIRHSETGWLVECGDVEAFGDAVVRLLSDARARGSIGEAAARDVRERLSWRRLVNGVERAYGVPL